jgi:murein DD-endopeptidase MepM/ murein hydrolase activator NlpD
MITSHIFHLRRTALVLPVLALVAACDEPLDFDLRGQIGAFNTSEAAQSATKNRPAPDSRGLITYPSYQVAVARRGDTVTDVANRVGLPASEVARFNGVQVDDKLRADEVLVLPRNAPGSTTPGEVDIASLAGDAINQSPDTTPADTGVTTSALEPAASKQQVQAGPEPVRHKVVRGETAYTISRLYQVPVKSLAEWNGLSSDFTIREGQYLLIPVKDASAPAAAAAPTTTTAPGQGTSTPTPPSATQPLPDEKIAAVAPEPPKTKVDPPTRSSGAEMTMPVQGKIIRTYSKGKNEGIDISAAAGSTVVSAAAGTVAAITADADQVPIIVIRHDANLLTVYANVDDIKVKKGDRVKKGQKIAALRGGSNPYLHFEVRDGFDSVNPQPYLE